MGTVFEELARRFNEQNNEEAGEHWTPREVVKLMARLILLPITDRVHRRGARHSRAERAVLLGQRYHTPSWGANSFPPPVVH